MGRISTDFDAIIVGARIAGSVLAGLLGQQGYRILLLDKTQFPSDTLSTHFFRSPALTAFRRLGALEDIKAAAPPLTILWNYIDGHVISEPIKTADDQQNYFLCARRITLDWILLQAVTREANIEIRQGANVKDLIWEDDQVTGVRWVSTDGIHEATARVVVGADGFYSTLAKILNPIFETQYPVQRCMFYTYFANIEPLSEVYHAEHHFSGNSLTYVFPTDGNMTMVAASLPIDDFQSVKKDPLKQLFAHFDSLPLLKPRLRQAEVVAAVKGAGNIPCYQRLPYGSGWVLVGDAEQIMDPWSGMGIDHASTHASILADQLHRFLSDEIDWEAAMREYHTQARGWSEKTYRRTSTFAADLRPMTRTALQKRGLI